MAYVYNYTWEVDNSGSRKLYRIVLDANSMDDIVIPHGFQLTDSAEALRHISVRVTPCEKSAFVSKVYVKEIDETNVTIGRGVVGVGYAYTDRNDYGSALVELVCHSLLTGS